MVATRIQILDLAGRGVARSQDRITASSQGGFMSFGDAHKAQWEVALSNMPPARGAALLAANDSLLTIHLAID